MGGVIRNLRQSKTFIFLRRTRQFSPFLAAQLSVSEIAPNWMILYAKQVLFSLGFNNFN